MSQRPVKVTGKGARRLLWSKKGVQVGLSFLCTLLNGYACFFSWLLTGGFSLQVRGCVDGYGVGRGWQIRKNDAELVVVSRGDGGCSGLTDLGGS
ncbi:hypothetical protein L1987_70891 [Smallanthus sonchifolius]|uniref:Uncharacterized protein n=1 Tax=Smallanthus sonchifolius TaxID=185202 RepID=A0ACB9AQJ8_9ASTR|nr:hypothetical protein L1987_70891 [Smallanthus sonchifolius]